MSEISTRNSATRVVFLSALIMLGLATAASAQIPGQFAQDFVAGRVPGEEEIARLEKEVAVHPADLRLVRMLGKGYFFQFFGEGRTSSAPKAQQMLERVLAINKDDAETLAYLGSLATLQAQRSKNPDEQKAGFERALPLLKRARELAPSNGAVLAVTGATYLNFPDSYGTVPLAAETMERFRKMMGPMFSRQSHHGQQRILLTQGQAYARLGRIEEARACFEDGLKVDQESVEAAMLNAEIGKLKAHAEEATRH